ncbi:MAG: urea transporter [Flavobacteriia bacterium]|nr:urea transporter [Flavobacteriia bacterium]
MQLKFWIDSTLNSYAQIFFSTNKVLAIFLLVVCFFYPISAIISILFVIAINALSLLIGLNKEWIKDGVYGFNAVLLSISLVRLYEINSVFVLVCVSSMVLLLINTVWISTMLAKYNAPMVSLPFLFTFWIVSLGIRTLPDLEINEMTLLETFQETNQSDFFYQVAHSMDFLQLPKAIEVYLKTLGSVFFQPTIFAGVLISIGLIYFSRITFTLTLIGLFVAFIFYNLIGANVNDLNVNLTGANYIFMAIALGGFYLIPNKWTYLLVIIMVPVLLLLYLFFNKILLVFQLNAFTFSFTVCVVLTMFLLNHRAIHKYLHIVSIQYYSAEKTIYKYVSSLNRFKNAHFFKFSLPFWGEWKVTQGYDGKITHLNEYKHALDFSIVDFEEKTYQNNGASLKDFYCYNKPVLAPADGYVYFLENTIEDNPIGEVDVENNWGNTIVINHLNGLYSQISHIKKDSFKVQIGDFVTKGTLLATCGNSGRSPEPHIHFQIQLNPMIGWTTLHYPLAYFIEKEKVENIKTKLSLKYFEVPKENSVIQAVKPDEVLSQTFQFHPGKKIKLTSLDGNQYEWEILTNAWNTSYIYCPKSKSFAYFVNDGTLFYFIDFEGDKKSLLFDFYLACNRVILGVYSNLEVEDQIPLHYFSNKVVKFIQDIIAPFYLFTKISYKSIFVEINNEHEPTDFQIQSKVNMQFFGRNKTDKQYALTFVNKQLTTFEIDNQTKFLCEF